MKKQFLRNVLKPFEVIFLMVLFGVILFEDTVKAIVFKPIPEMTYPSDNPWSKEKESLGQKLFFDPMLSGDNTMSCSSCHLPDKGWADERARGKGFQGMVLGRNTPTILNSGYSRFQFWDGRATSLEEQAVAPIQSPVEMNQNVEALIKELEASEIYPELFEKAFGDKEVTLERIAKAIATFERTINSGTNAFDRYGRGDKDALSLKAKKGMRLFFGKAKCSICHAGPFFTDQQFHNIGIPPLDKKDLGRQKVTGEAFHLEAFKTPGLRDIALTGPYMHNGSLRTLEAVIEYYDRGGVPHANKSPFITPIGMNVHEKENLLEFMKSLTSDQYKTQVEEQKDESLHGK